MTRKSAGRRAGAVAAAIAIALSASACGGSSLDGAAPSGTTSSSKASSNKASTTAAAASAGASAGDLNDDATWCDHLKRNWPDISGTTITVYSVITGSEGNVLPDSWKDFTECTGAQVQYNPDKNFETQIVVQAKSGNAPNIAIVPQPGLLATVVATGAVVAPAEGVEANVDKYWEKSWKDYGTVNGTFYAAPFGANVKSLVWYSPKMFQAKGYAVPETWDEMIALSDKIAASGEKPWCAGIESGAATGWPVTDWLEEIVMRQSGPDVYDQWVAHDVKFSDEPIAKALATTGSIWKNPDYVNGGIGDVSSIVTTASAEGGLPIQNGQCYMHQQASYYSANWKNHPDISENGDIWAFYLPPMGDQYGKPLEVGGDFVAAFSTDPQVQAFQWYLSTAHWANNQSIATGTRISANKGLDVKNVADPISKLSVTMLQDPDAVSRFDASDMMPAAVGTSAEWQQLTAWVAGQDDESTLAAIDARWPAG